MEEHPALHNLIFEIRGHKVMLDSDLAQIYHVETKALNRAVKRNIGRFPPQFMFRLTAEEYESLRCQIGTLNNLKSQIATSNEDLKCQIGTSSLRCQIGTSNNLISQFAISSSHGGRRKLPYAFTEHGVLMLSSVLNSQRAIDMNVLIIQAFVAMRQLVEQKTPTLSEFKELKRMLMLHIENTGNRLSGHDERISQIIEALNNLIGNPPSPKQIGFRAITRE
jgi:phage regulator Rha-like protein